MNILKLLFPRFFRQPKPGEEWVHLDYLTQRGPWDTDGVLTYRVLILDAKQGWVRYKLNRFFPDERMRIGDFINIYHPVD